MTERRIKAGEQTLVRNVREAMVRFATPVTVVEDSPERLVYLLKIGTPCIRMGDADGNPTREFAKAVRRVPFTWVDHHALHIVPSGAAHSLTLFWRGSDGQFVCWYVNLQEPIRRTGRGFETMDQMLDVVISPGLSRYWWKDEDEFEAAVRLGLYSPDEAAAIRAEGERVIAMAMARQGPFAEGWEHWKPDPAWPIPALPEWWDEMP